MTSVPALSLSPAPPPKTSADKAADAARDFEAVFLSETLKPMFEGLETDGMFGGGKGEEVFRGMLLSEYGKMIAQKGGVGLSGQIREQLIKMQEQIDHGKKPNA